MNAKELRIGNLIYWNIPEKLDTIHTVVGIRNEKPQTIPISLGESIEDYKPIPLTPEILIKSGFKSNPTMGGMFWVKRNRTKIQLRTTETGYVEYLHSAPCDHLHQLQNIYYALTGEELTIDL